MTILLFGCRISTLRLPFPPESSVGRCLRVPPTGIPRPDREDAPLAGFDPVGFGPVGLGPAVGAVLMGLLLLAPSLTATTVLANTSSGTGITWQPGHGVGITPVLDAPVLDVATVADGRPAQTGGAAINHRSPEQIRQTSWSARPVHTSQSQSGQSQSGQLQAGEQGDDATHATVLPGQVVRISLAAYDPSRYGVVMGVVRRVASNTTQPENAMPFYETIITIPEVAFTKSPEEPVISSGMPLQVDILGGKRTVMEYIMTPIQKSLATAFREN